MDSKAPTNVIVSWSAPDDNLSRDNFLELSTDAIANTRGIESSKSFLISEHQAAFSVETELELDELVEQLSDIFAPKYHLKPGDTIGGTRRLAVLPNPDYLISDTKPAEREDDPATVEKITAAPSPPASVDEETSEQAIQPENPTLYVHDGETSEAKKRQDLNSRPRILHSNWMRAIQLVAPVAIIYWLLLRHLVGNGAYPNSTDAFANLYRAVYVADEWKIGNMLPLWTPGWYMGTPLVEFYGPLTTLILAPLTYIGGITFAYQIFTMLGFGFAAVSTVFLFRDRIGAPGAVFAAIAYSLAPFAVRTIFSGGAMPATLVFAVQPLFFWAIIGLVDKPSRGKFLAVSLITAFAILSHQLFAVMFMASIGSGLVLLTLAKRNNSTAVAVALVAMFAGIGLTSIWLFSAQTPTNFDNLPLPHDGETRFLTSRSFEVFNPSQRSDPEATYIGFVLILTGLIGFAVSSRNNMSIVLIGATVTSVFMMFGMNNPVITTLPLLDEFIFFERFLLSTSFTFAILGGILISYVVDKSRSQSFKMPQAKFVAPAAIFLISLAVVSFDSQPYYSTLVRQTDHAVWQSASESIDANAPDGRFADFIGRPEPSFFPSQVGRDSLTGWFLQGTSHWDQIGLLNQTLNLGHTNYVDRQLEQWWVTGAYALDENDLSTAALLESGFEPVEFGGGEGTGITPWKRTEYASIVSELQRNSVTVGKAHSIVGVVLPWTTQAGIDRLDDLGEVDLEFIQLLVMAEAESAVASRTSERLEEFRRQGGIVLSVLGNDESVWKAGLGSRKVRLPNSFDLLDTDGNLIASLSGLIENVDVWEGVFIDDSRAETLLRLVAEDGTDVPLLSRFDDPSGSVYVLGGGYYNMAFSWPDLFPMTHIENELTVQIPNLTTGTGLTPVPAEVIENSSKRLIIEVVNGDMPVRSLISTTYAPHWKTVLLDGEPVEIEEYERIIMLDLPPGPHSIELVQGIPSSYAKGSIMSLAVLILIGLFFWRPYLLERPTASIRHRWQKFVAEIEQEP